MMVYSKGFTDKENWKIKTIKTILHSETELGAGRIFLAASKDPNFVSHVKVQSAIINGDSGCTFPDSLGHWE